MSAHSKKIIAIVGATGKQGGSVARTFLSAPLSSNWRVHCITRNSSSEAAKSLAALGAKIIEADLSSVPDLVLGFTSANAIFVNTNFWEVYRKALAAGKSGDEASQLGYETEVSWGQNAAIAASQIPELERFVYSALGSMKIASGGKYARCYHFEAKAAVAAHINTAMPQLASKTSFFYASGYSDNPLLTPHKVSYAVSWILWILSKFPGLVQYLPGPQPNNGKPKENSASSRGQYLMVFPAKTGNQSTSFPVFNPYTSTGLYVRSLVEDEPAGTKLLAVDWWLGLEDSMHIWEIVTGLKAHSIEATVQLLCWMTGRKAESVESAAYLAEFPYMCDVENWIEPAGLRHPPHNPTSYEDYLRTKYLNELIL